MKNKFIIIEGNEGVGKSTQIKSIEKYLNKHDIDFVLTREPGGTKIGNALRKIILDENYESQGITDALLFYASRFENYNKVILPALDNNKTVLCDRFHYSTLVYQGMLENNELVKKIHKIFDEIFSEKIDHVIYLRTTPEESFRRISKRTRTDKFESKGIEYLKKIDTAYQDLFSSMHNVIEIDTSGDKDLTEEKIFQELNKIFNLS